MPATFSKCFQVIFVFFLGVLNRCLEAVDRSPLVCFTRLARSTSRLTCQPAGNLISITGKVQVRLIGKPANDWPAQCLQPGFFTNQLPGSDSDIQTQKHLTLVGKTMEDTIGLPDIDFRIPVRETGTVYILEFQVERSVQIPQLFHFLHAQGTKPVVENCQQHRRL